MTSSGHNDKQEAKQSQARPNFDWAAQKQAIQVYEKLGLRYFPVVWGSKRPAIAWKIFQNRPPNFSELAEWFHEGKPTNVGIICGGVSNGLVALCFNAPDGAIEFFGQELWNKLLASTFIVKTPRGVHVYLRSNTPMPSQFVAKGGNQTWLEIRADGNYIAAPPSLHPSGVFYENIGVESVAKPKNLPDYIEQRLSTLGLKGRMFQESPKSKGDQFEEALGREQSNQFNDLAVEKLVENCAFIQYSRNNAATLSEPYWWSMVHNLVVFGEPGREKIHEFSRPYPTYSERETSQKIEEAQKAVGKGVSPHSCDFIGAELGFTCPEHCLAKKLGTKSPAGLAYRLARTAGLPTIVVTNRFLKEKTADTIAAVEQANNPPQIFERSSHIVRIGHDEFGAPYIETLTESACRGFIERAASYVRVNDKGKTVPLPAPPLDLVRDYMSVPNRNLPALLGLTEIPILRSDGSIVTQPGYDEVTHLYYQPSVGLMMLMVPDNPSQKELEAAVALIQEPIIDFPFDSESSRTNALAVMVTPIYRPMITGPVPLCLIDKPQPGTGASLLSDIIAIIATGRPAAMMAPPKNDEECEKRLTSILRHGRAVITIDNVDGYLYFPSLAMILTATTVQTRILGKSEELLLPNRATYIVTGNNVRLAGDLPRRCYLSRMDARDARPWMRDPKSFKYEHLTKWVRENRGRVLAAILTMARAWIVAGKPIAPELPSLGGFEEWTNTVGGVLACASFKGFLGNLDFMYSQSDVETAQWENFLGAWQEFLGGDMVTVTQVIKTINENEDFAGALPDAIDRDPKKINRSLAHALSKRVGVRYPNGLMVTKSDKVVHHAVAWQVLNF